MSWLIKSYDFTSQYIFVMQDHMKTKKKMIKSCKIDKIK